MNPNEPILPPGLEDEEPPHPAMKFLKYGALLLALALAGAVALHFWNRQTPRSEQEYLASAAAALAKGEAAAAAIQYKNALRMNPRNAEARLQLARLHLQQGMGSEAEEQLQVARGLGVENRVLALPLAEALLLQNKYDKVLQELQPERFGEGPDRAQAERIQADALLGLGRPAEACPLFQRAHDHNPRDLQALWGLMKCAMAKQDFQSARTHLDAALALEPRNTRNFMLKGELAQAMRDLAGAEAAYAEAIAADPAFIPAWITRALMRLAAGKKAEAMEDLQALKQRAPNNLMVRYLDALLAYRDGRLAEAQNLIQGVVAQAPEHQPSRLLSGLVAYRLEQYRQVDKDLSLVLVWQPDNHEIRLPLAHSRLKSGQPEAALAVLEPLLKESANHPEALAAAGEAYLLLGKPEQAAAFMSRAAKLSPDDANLRSQAGLWRMRAGDSAGAARELEAAASMQALPLQAESLRVTTLLIRKAFDDALAAADAMTRRFPKEGIAHHLQGLAHLGKNDTASARRSFEQALAVQPANLAAVKSLARLDMLQGRPDAAAKRYESLLRHDPGNHQAMLELAELARSRGQGKDYLAWLHKAATAAPAERQPRLLLARHYLAGNEPAKALPWARQLLDLDPRNAVALELHGDVQLANGDRDNALYSYLQWTQVALDSARAHYKLGSAQTAAGHPVAARESLERALRLQPDYPDAVIALASLAQAAGKHQEAIRLARELRQRHPALWQGHALEGDSQTALGSHAEALKAYAQAFRLQRSRSLFVRLHQAMTQAGKADQARALRDSWLRDAARDVPTRLYLGYSQLRLGQAREAQAEFQAALALEPANVPALVGMSSSLHAQNDARALGYAEQAYQKSGRNAETADLLGWMLVQRGQTRRGLELLQQAMLLAPDNPGIRYHLAATLVKLGELEVARPMLEALLLREKNFPQRAEAEALLKQVRDALRSD